MATLMSPQAGKLVNIPDDQVPQAYLEGQVHLPKGGQIPVAGPDGSLGYVPQDQVHLAFQEGYRYAPEDVRKAEVDAKYGGPLETAKAAAEGVASGITFGGSRLLERAMGVKAADMAGRKEASPVVSTGSEIAGAVLPSVLSEVYSGGTATPGIMANAARILSAPVRGVAALGEGAAEAVIPQAGGALARALKAGVSGAVQGPAYGAGQLVSETAMGDPQLNAEHVLTTLGLSAVIGGVAGAGVSLLGDTGGALLPKTAPKGLGPDSLENFAGQRAFNAARPTKTDVRIAEGRPGGIEKLGNDWLDQGIVSMGSTARQSEERAAAKVQEFGQKLKGAYDDLDTIAQGPGSPGAMPALQPQTLFQNLKAKVLAPFAKDPTMDVGVKQVDALLDRYAQIYGQKPSLSFDDLWTIRKQVDSAIKDAGWNKFFQDKDTRSFVDVAIPLRQAIQDETFSAADSMSQALGKPSASAVIKDLNSKFSSATQAETLFGKRVAAEESNHSFGLIDLLTGGIGAAHDLGTGAAMVVGSKLMRKFGNQTAASAADTFAKIERAIAANNTRIGSSIKAIFAPGTQAAVARTVPVAEFPVFSALNEPKPKDRLEAFKQQRRDLQNLQSNPGQLVDNMAKSAGPLADVAPTVTTAMQGSATNIMNALNAAMPKDPSQNPANPMKAEWRPSETELGRWQRTVRTAEDPLSTTVENLSRNIYDPVAWNFLKQAYPSLYAQIQQQAMSEMTEYGANPNHAPLPLAKRIQMAQAFGIGEDAITPASIQLSQQAYAQAAQEMQQQQPAKKGAPGKSEKDTYSLATNTQRLEAR